MKKLVWFAVLGLCFITAVFAKVVVFEDGKATSYEQGSSVSVSGETATRVLYDGILIDVPEGQKVQISTAKDGNILVSGEDIKGVVIDGEEISSEGQAVFSVSPNDRKIYQTEAAVKEKKEELKQQKELAKQKAEAVKKQAEAAKQKVQKDVKVASQKATYSQSETTFADFPDTSNYVNEVVMEQAVMDVVSPYAPR